MDNALPRATGDDATPIPAPCTAPRPEESPWQPGGAIPTGERRFRALLEFATDLVCVADGAGEVLYVSPSVYRILGYAPPDLLGSSMIGYAHPDDVPPLLEAIERSVQCTCPVGPCHTRVRHAGGTWRILELVVNSRLDDPEIGAVIINGHDVTEREELAAALRKRADEAEILARARADFVASVSHELRTPLTAIIGFADLLRERWDRFNETQRAETLFKVVDAARRQYRLVNDLLLLSKVEDGSYTPQHLELIPLADLAEHVADEARASHDKQRITLAGPSDLAAYGDSDRAHQIIANLVDNAIKYSPEGSTIMVSWRREGQYAALRVRDQGPGIPDHGRDRLFTRFGRVPGSRARAGQVGTGLGLYLGRQIARAMGGALDLESTGPGGSTFRLLLLVEPSGPVPTAP